MLWPSSRFASQVTTDISDTATFDDTSLADSISSRWFVSMPRDSYPQHKLSSFLRLSPLRQPTKHLHNNSHTRGPFGATEASETQRSTTAFHLCSVFRICHSKSGTPFSSVVFVSASSRAETQSAREQSSQRGESPLPGQPRLATISARFCGKISLAHCFRHIGQARSSTPATLHRYEVSVGGFRQKYGYFVASTCETRAQ